MRRIPPSTHPEVAAQAEQTLAHAARRFDPTALGRIAERLLAHLDPDGDAPSEEPETIRELRVRTRPDGTVTLNGKLDPEGGARVLEVLGSLNGRRPHPHWLDGGETKLDNMCLLCEYHHTIVHRQGWHIRIDARGHPEFMPPHTVDPQRRPLHDPLRQ